MIQNQHSFFFFVGLTHLPIIVCFPSSYVFLECFFVIIQLFLIRVPTTFAYQFTRPISDSRLAKHRRSRSTLKM